MISYRDYKTESFYSVKPRTTPAEFHSASINSKDTSQLDQQIDSMFDDLKKRVHDMTMPRSSFLSRFSSKPQQNPLFRQQPNLEQYTNYLGLVNELQTSLNEANEQYIDDVIEDYRKKFKAMVASYLANVAQKPERKSLSNQDVDQSGKPYDWGSSYGREEAPPPVAMKSGQVVAHWDKNKKQWRIYQGNKLEWADEVTLRNVHFMVQPEGREEVREKKASGSSEKEARAPHAYIFGYPTNTPTTEGDWKPFNYNPFSEEPFFHMGDNKPLVFAQFVKLGPGRKQALIGPNTGDVPATNATTAQPTTPTPTSVTQPPKPTTTPTAQPPKPVSTPQPPIAPTASATQPTPTAQPPKPPIAPAQSTQPVTKPKRIRKPKENMDELAKMGMAISMLGKENPSSDEISKTLPDIEAIYSDLPLSDEEKQTFIDAARKYQGASSKPKTVQSAAWQPVDEEQKKLMTMDDEEFKKFITAKMPELSDAYNASKATKKTWFQPDNRSNAVKAYSDMLKLKSQVPDVVEHYKQLLRKENRPIIVPKNLTLTEKIQFCKSKFKI